MIIYVKEGIMSSIADAIREKREETREYTIDEMPELIRTIEAAGLETISKNINVESSEIDMDLSVTTKTLV